VYDLTTDNPAIKARKDQRMEKRHTKILIEKDEVVVWRAAKPIVAWCKECQTETQKVTTIQAALLFQVDQNAIWERIQSGELHVSEMSAAGLLICLNSLQQQR
jgi:hypothetical protein